MSVQGGFGVEVKIAVSGTQTVIANLEDMDYPEFEKILAERTGNDADSGWATHVASGKRKANAFTCLLTWDDTEATHQAIIAAFDSDDPVDMTVLDPDGTETITFSAHVSKMGRVSKQEGAYRCNVTIQPTGKPTIA